MYEHITPESIADKILSEIEEFSTAEGSFARTLISPAAVEIWKYYTALEGVENMIFPDADSGKYIDKKAADFGIVRKDGAAAEAAISFTGKAGTVIPAGKVFLTADGYRYTLDEAVTLDAAGMGSGRLTAVEAGAAYNTVAGEISVQQSPLAGLVSFSAGEASGGVDKESDASLLERYYAFIRRPATSGNVYQYEQWAVSVTGIGKARVFPLWAGPGTVQVVVASEENGIVDGETVAECAAYIETVRPIGAEVTVVSAKAVEIVISANVVTDATTTAEIVQTALEKMAEEYLKSISFSADAVIYNRILAMILSIDGVQDVISLMVNGGETNIVVAEDQIPVLGEVTVGA